MGRIRARLSTALFTRVAGPDGEKHRERIHGTPGPRWFEPGSPITRVHGDASMYVGGIRAVLLQTLQPQAMTAVAEHSGYRGDMWGRLARTQPVHRRHHVRHGRRRPAGRRRRARHPRPGQRRDARRLGVRRHRPASPALGARRGDPELPARPPALRRAAARPGGPGHLRRAGGHHRPQARRPRTAHHRGRAGRRRRELPPRAGRDRPRAGCGGLPHQAAGAPPRRPPGVRRAGRGRGRADARVDPQAARSADPAGRPRPGRRRARSGLDPHDPLGHDQRPRSHRDPARPARARWRGGGRLARATTRPARPCSRPTATRDAATTTCAT